MQNMPTQTTNAPYHQTHLHSNIPLHSFPNKPCHSLARPHALKETKKPSLSVEGNYAVPEFLATSFEIQT